MIGARSHGHGADRLAGLRIAGHDPGIGDCPGGDPPISKLPSLVALASLAVILPAQAQNIPFNAITVTIPGNSPCRVTPVSITTGKSPSDVRFTFNNTGASPISFTLRMTISGTSAGSTLSRTLPDVTFTARPTGSNTVEIGGLSTPLSTLATPSATVVLANCVNAAANRPLANM